MYSVIWEYLAKSGKESAFERVYGPGGTWAELFARADGFVGVSLHRDVILPRRYLVIDRWSSPEAYEAFRSQFAGQYEALDKEYSVLSDRESPLGSFETLA